MSRFEDTLPATYFDAMYSADPDPWAFAASAYERDKYTATLAALPRLNYETALEVGCSIGVLTRQLASRCAALLAVDVAHAALDQARKRCIDVTHVVFDLMHVPDDWPGGRFDLVMLSEVVYYLAPDDVDRLADRVGESILPGGDVLLVHWLGATHYPLSGDEAADSFIAASASWSRPLLQARTDAYRIDVLRAAEDSATEEP